MTYQHKSIDGTAFQLDGRALPVGKAVCVGRNYLDHVQELGNQVSELPLLFMKPASAFVDINKPVSIPLAYGECHNELELAFLIGKKLSSANQEQCAEAIVGFGLALDLTLRDLQNQLKQDGHPWERAKAFDGSCPVSGFIPLAGYEQQAFEFKLRVNGELKQHGNSDLMLHRVLPLISHMSEMFTLLPGDVILTGTPKGVGPLHDGDSIDIELCDHFAIQTSVVGAKQ